MDSIDFSTHYGAVQEIDESNNLAQSTVTAATSAGATANPAAAGQSPSPEALPRRR